MTSPTHDVRAAVAPITLPSSAPPPPKPESGVGLCLSGGGYRAMVFHLGVIWRLNELALLPKLTRISSVSGGSITAGMLALKWNLLGFEAGVGTRYVAEVVDPILNLAGKTIDAGAIVRGLLLPGSISDRIAKAYDKYLFDGATLQDIPDEPPRFIINATSVQTGSLVRFTKGAMRDYQVGRFITPTLRLSKAVAASSSFPPVLSPTLVRPGLPPEEPPSPGEDLRRPPFTTELVLSDGGVYDNLGLETVWKRCATVLVSDAGGKLGPDPKPKRDWARHGIRISDVVDNQVRSLRKRQLISSFVIGEREGAYWSIRTALDQYNAAKPLPCPPERTAELAAVKTRLAAMDGVLQERLVNWGYAICDVALRTYVDPFLPAATTFPYPKSGV